MAFYTRNCGGLVYMFNYPCTYFHENVIFALQFLSVKFAVSLAVYVKALFLRFSIYTFNLFVLLSQVIYVIKCTELF